MHPTLIEVQVDPPSQLQWFVVCWADMVSEPLTIWEAESFVESILGFVQDSLVR